METREIHTRYLEARVRFELARSWPALRWLPEEKDDARKYRSRLLDYQCISLCAQGHLYEPLDFDHSVCQIEQFVSNLTLTLDIMRDEIARRHNAIWVTTEFSPIDPDQISLTVHLANRGE